ncbi:MAG: M20 family metallopeptidase [Fusobacteriaceae bacterium]|jgi:acetylornithine deacetylase/succinyl-diaminopimelate desuccinylase family protein|nr:M20 family metallopeptidase [Fusobacteriaceae bacterium]
MDVYKEMALEILRDLISFQSVNKPGDEKPVAEYIEGLLKREGFSTELQIVGENRANIIARTGEGPCKLILNGHLDVVPAGEGWTKEAFTLTKEGEYLYGRGTCDMKGAIAAMITAAIRLKREGAVKGNCELVLAFVADEEVDGIGTKRFIQNFQKGKRNWVVVGEATGNQLNIAHRGVIRFRVTIKGKQCHAGQPDAGINALTLMAAFLLKIDQWNEALGKMKPDILPPPTVAATVLHGGIKDNIIPGTCEVVLDCRTVPGDTRESLERKIEGILTDLFHHKEIGWAIEEFIQVTPSAVLPSSDIVRTAGAVYAEYRGNKPKITYFPACCDMSWFHQGGFEAIIWGPGSIDQAHIKDEFLEEKQLYEAMELYRKFFLKAQESAQ